MNNSQKYKQIFKDIKYIEDKYGQVNDYCGGWCNNDVLTELLLSPNIQTALKLQISFLERYFAFGYDQEPIYIGVRLPVEDDKKLQVIKDRWHIE